MLTVVTLPTAGHRPPSVAIDRAHDILALCLEHAEQLPRAACFLLFNCRFLAVVERHLEQPKPQVVPSSKGSEGRVQADKQTAKALLTVRERLDWPGCFFWKSC